MATSSRLLLKKLVPLQRRPDLDQAVTFYEHCRESINRLNTRNDNWLGTGEPLAIPDKTSERLEALNSLMDIISTKKG